MKYGKVVQARFIARPNRFIAYAQVDGIQVTAHVKNTGRCRELLLPGAKIYLEESDNPARKTKYSLIGVEKEGRLINMDSQAPNRVVEEALRSGWLPSCWRGLHIDQVRREVTWRDSRLDFVLEGAQNLLLIEVKGVTLEEHGAVFFPDAPTQRGVKHIQELAQAVKEGRRACALFVVQMQCASHFSPNDRTHPAFGEALRNAAGSGVDVIAVTCNVTPDSLKLSGEIPVRL